MGRRAVRAAIATVFLAAGLGVVGVVNAGNALADCGGSSGDSCGDSKIIFGVEQQAGHFGETLHIHGFVDDDSNGCFLSRFACHLPAGKVVVTDQTGRVLGQSYLAYEDNDSAQWGFHWNGPGNLQGAPPSSEITIHTLPAGNYTATATYVPESINGDGYFDASTATFDFSVAKADTDVALTQSNATTVTGQTTTLTATVTGVFNGLYADEFGGFAHKPEGAVLFYEDGEVIDAALLDANAQASITTVLNEHGHGFGQLFAEYVGLNDYNGDASAVVSHSFTKGNTTLTLTQPSSATPVGPNFPITATVTAASPAAGTPTGTVTFVDTTLSQTLGTISLASGAGTIQVGGNIGVHAIKATYNGDSGFNSGANNTITHTVTKGDVTNVLTQKDATTVFGEPLEFTSALGVVAPATGTPTGNVTFSDGATPIGLAPYASSVVITPSLEVGTHSISSAYVGDSAFNAKTSNTVTHVVNKADTTTALAASVPDPVPLGKTVTYTATVAVVAPGVATPSGSVQFYEGTVALGAPVPLSGNNASYSMTLGGGTHSVTAKYLGDGHLNASTSPAVVRTVQCTNVISGAVTNLTVPAGTLTCVVGGTIRGTVKVNSGGAVYMSSARVNGGVTTTNASAVMVCGSYIGGMLKIDGTTGAVVVGLPGTGCPGSQINGRATFTGNHGGVQVGANKINGGIACTTNTPPPTNGGAGNNVRSRSGQCATPGF